MSRATAEVHVRIEGLDSAGNVVGLERDANGYVVPAGEGPLTISQETVSLDLVKGHEKEIVVLALHDVVDHVVVSYNQVVVSPNPNMPASIVDHDKQSVRSLLLKPNEPVVLYQRAGLIATFEQIHGYRLTRF